jgi:hypothetical protein
MRFGLIVGFIALLKLVTTINYSAVDDSHSLQFTAARTKSFQSAVSSLVVTLLLKTLI